MSACHVLIVDDEPGVVNATARILRLQGIQVSTAASGREALDRLEGGLDRDVNVLLTDYRMPGMTGVELLREVLRRWPSIQRILFTGNAESEALAEAINEAQVSRFVSKPIDEVTLVTKVREAAEFHRLEAENARLQALLREQNELLIETNRVLAERIDHRTALLSRAKREWEVAFDAILDPLMILDADYRIIRANVAMADHLGCDVRELPGRACHELRAKRSAHPIARDDDGVCSGCPVKRVAKGGDADAAELETQSNRTLHVGAYPIAHEAGRAVVCVYRDRTEEVALRRQLTQADKLSAIGLLAGGVAHEINNPLGAVLAFTQILLREDDVEREERRDYLREVESSALRCKEIVMRLLSFARQARPEEIRKFNVNDVVVETAFLVERSVLPQGIRLVRELDDRLELVVGNPNELAQVLVNLVTNARDAIPAGGGEIRVCTRNLVDEASVELSVTDTGVGIPERDIEKIFDPFFTTKPEGKGTGLGLAVSYGIVRSMKGRITVKSRIGEGTEFRVVIPVAVDPVSRPRGMPEG